VPKRYTTAAIFVRRGRVTLAAHKNRGFLVRRGYLSIVRRLSTNAAGERSMNVQTTTTTKRRIAVIDDDTVFIDLMHDLLAVGEGYDVVSAPHWLQSVEFVREMQPDLIILDLMLGREQTGWGVLQLLREDPSMVGIPVILCSAAAPVLQRLDAPPVGHGAVEAVAKPFDVDDLLEVVERLLQTSGKSIA
jgi:CheY-like chemotaxis protein